MRNAIRIAIPFAAAAAIALGLALHVHHPLPSVALGSSPLLRLERALAFFYGFLLLAVPVLRALGGELPIELSARGARYAEVSDRSFEELWARVEALEHDLDDTTEIVAGLAE